MKGKEMKFDEYKRKDMLLNFLKSAAEEVKMEAPTVVISFDVMNLNQGFGYKMVLKELGSSAEAVDKFFEVRNYLADLFNWFLQGNIDVSSFTEDAE